MSYFPDTVWNVIDNKSWKTKGNLECESCEAALHIPESFKLYIALHSA